MPFFKVGGKMKKVQVHRKDFLFIFHILKQYEKYVDKKYKNYSNDCTSLQLYIIMRHQTSYLVWKIQVWKINTRQNLSKKKCRLIGIFPFIQQNRRKLIVLSLLASFKRRKFEFPKTKSIITFFSISSLIFPGFCK